VPAQRWSTLGTTDLKGIGPVELLELRRTTTDGMHP